jgi:hypothetical protein
MVRDPRRRQREPVLRRIFDPWRSPSTWWTLTHLVTDVVVGVVTFTFVVTLLAVIAGFGALGGIAVGVLVGCGLTRSFSGDLPLDVFAAPAGRLVLIATAGAVAGILAAARPARRAARMPVLSALAGE